MFDGNRLHEGNFNDKKAAFDRYKKLKALEIKRLADEYKDKIPAKIYLKLINYEI